MLPFPLWAFVLLVSRFSSFETTATIRELARFQAHPWIKRQVVIAGMIFDGNEKLVTVGLPNRLKEWDMKGNPIRDIGVYKELDTVKGLTGV